MARTSQSYTLKQWQKANEDLLNLPEKPKEEKQLTPKEGVEVIKAGIRASQKKGYSLEEIHRRLNESGVSVSFSTLKQYASEGKRKSSKPATTATAERPGSSSEQGVQS